MRFVDLVRVIVRAGNGGDGAVAWRREKYVPKGGPAGGDGGQGGDVVLEADPHLSTLLDLRYRQRLHAEHGQPGGIRDRNGRGGEDLVVKVPLGTVVFLEGPADAPPPEISFEDDADEDDEGMQTVYVVGDPAALERLREARAQLEAESGTARSRAPDQVVVPEPEAAEDDGDDEQADDGSADDLAEADDDGEEPDDAEHFDHLDHPEHPEQGDEGDDEPIVPLELTDDHGLRPASELVAHAPGELLGDLSRAGQRLVIARGGRGGRGNIHFRSATNRAPDHAEDGQPGEAWRIRLELKLLADVGIVGFPNVGKSTLIRKVSRARPKVGAYPFTTLVPNLGVVQLSGGRSMVVADVPGLIRGASDGKGLGLQFLRHLERTRVLLHLLAPDYGPGREPLADLDALELELSRYGSQFDGRPRVVALNKRDLLHDDEGRERVAVLREQLRARNIPLFLISAQTGAGIPKLLEAIWRRLAPL